MTAELPWEKWFHKEHADANRLLTENYLLRQSIKMLESEAMNEIPRNRGHGHVHPRPDGFKARCGGPGLCAECSCEAFEGKVVPDYGPTPELYKRAPAPPCYRTDFTPRPDLTLTLTVEGEPTAQEIRDAQAIMFAGLPARVAEQNEHIERMAKLFGVDLLK